MNALDYYNNPEITSYMKQELVHIRNREDREDCEQEIFAELYDFMPLDTVEAIRIVKRVCERFKRTVSNILTHEVSIDD